MQLLGRQTHHDGRLVRERLLRLHLNMPRAVGGPAPELGLWRIAHLPGRLPTLEFNATGLW